MYEKEATKIAELMRKRLEEKYEKYGDSWKTDNPILLQNSLFAKFLQYKKRTNITGLVPDLIDIANQAMLLALRLSNDYEESLEKKPSRTIKTITPQSLVLDLKGLNVKELKINIEDFLHLKDEIIANLVMLLRFKDSLQYTSLGMNQCPFCGCTKFTHYRCGKPVVQCLNPKCGTNLMYWTQYVKYDKKRVDEIE